MFKEYSLDGSHDTVMEILGDLVDSFPELAIGTVNYFKFKGSSEATLRQDWMIRFNPDIIRVPCSEIDPCNRIYAVERQEQEKGRYGTPKPRYKIGTFDVSTLVVGHLKEWEDNHPAVNGSKVSSVGSMHEKLNAIYGEIHGGLTADDVVTGYEISNFQRFSERQELSEQEKRESHILYVPEGFRGRVVQSDYDPSSDDELIRELEGDVV